MREDDESQPILGKSAGRAAFGADPYQALNAAPDDFSELREEAPGRPDPPGPPGPPDLPGLRGLRGLRGLLDWPVVGLSVGVLLTSVGSLVGMPVMLAGLVTHSSDPFALCFVLPTGGVLLTLCVVLVLRRAARGTARQVSLYPFFLRRAAVLGALLAARLVLHAFCGVPSRTPAFLQAGSFVVVLPVAALTRFALTRKAFTCRQVACILVVAASVGLVMLNLVGHRSYMPGSLPPANLHAQPASLHAQPASLHAQPALNSTWHPNTSLRPPARNSSSPASTSRPPAGNTSSPTPTSRPQAGNTSSPTPMSRPQAGNTSSPTRTSHPQAGNTSSPAPTSSSPAGNTASPAPTTPNPLAAVPSAEGRVLWCLGFTLGWVFYGIAMVLLDQPIREKGGHPMVVCLYAHLLTCLWIVFLFFVDLIPTLGWAVYLSDFRNHLHHGVKCLVGADVDCGAIAWRSWLQILIYTGFFAVQCHLVAVARCPLYPLLVACCAVPLAGIVWLCLADTGLALVWFPSAGPLVVLALLALLVALPATLLYRHYVSRDQKDSFQEL